MSTHTPPAADTGFKFTLRRLAADSSFSSRWAVIFQRDRLGSSGVSYLVRWRKRWCAPSDQVFITDINKAGRQVTCHCAMLGPAEEPQNTERHHKQSACRNLHSYCWYLLHKALSCFLNHFRSLTSCIAEHFRLHRNDMLVSCWRDGISACVNDLAWRLHWQTSVTTADS